MNLKAFLLLRPAMLAPNHPKPPPNHPKPPQTTSDQSHWMQTSPLTHTLPLSLSFSFSLSLSLSGRYESGLGWFRGGLGWFGGGLGWFGGVLGLTWHVNVIKMLLNFFFNIETITKNIFWVLRKWFGMV